jgi:sulfhydrogenase subunit beta (sulfur reductase)
MEGEGGQALWLERGRLGELLAQLARAGYRVLGPRLRDGSVVFDAVRTPADLPTGWRDEQSPGAYRLTRAGGPRAFGVVHGPGSIKPFAFAPREPLIQVQLRRDDGGFEAAPVLPAAQPVALLGVRACDLAGLAVQDRIFLEDQYPDPHYAARRRGLFLVGVSCTRSVDTCFCTSMGTGPEVRRHHDLALSELDDGFVVRCGSAAGAAMIEPLGLAALREDRLAEERAALDACAQGITRRLDAAAAPRLLAENLEHPRWDEVAERCLSCGNCTLVCPTCFCHDEREEPELDGSASLRVREWDSCFDPSHARIHGVDFRPRVRDRYRQWLVHKLSTWVEQFGNSGCVGCGRCITWCPVGIDLTEEVAAIAEEAA